MNEHDKTEEEYIKEIIHLLDLVDIAQSRSFDSFGRHRIVEGVKETMYGLLYDASQAELRRRTKACCNEEQYPSCRKKHEEENSFDFKGGD